MAARYAPENQEESKNKPAKNSRRRRREQKKQILTAEGDTTESGYRYGARRQSWKGERRRLKEARETEKISHSRFGLKQCGKPNRFDEC